MPTRANSTTATNAPNGRYCSEALAQLDEVDVEHHHHKEEQHGHSADIDDDQDHGEKLGAHQNEQARGIEESEDEEQHRVHGIARRDHHHSRSDGHGRRRDRRRALERTSLPQRYGASSARLAAIWRFPALAVFEQLALVVEQLLAGLGRELEIRAFNDSVDWARFLAEAAIDALGHVDVIARRAAAAVLARLGFDGDGERRADRLAQLAGDAAFLAVGITPERSSPRKRGESGPFS